MITRILSTGWSWEAGPLIGIAVLSIWYLAGTAKVWRRAGMGHGIHAGQAAAFGCGVLALVAALLSPVDALADEQFSVHMLQHMLLILAAAPLLALSGLPIAAFSLLPRRWAASLGRSFGRQSLTARMGASLSRPVVVWIIFAIVLCVWHVPGLYETALRNDVLHALEHICLLLFGLLYWWILFQPANNRAARLGISLLYLFTTGLQMSLMGALFTFAGHPLYSAYAAQQSKTGIDALQDQQLAGLIMWVPGGLLFTLLSAGFFIAWFNALEERASRMEVSKRWKPKANPDPLELPIVSLPEENES